MSPAQGPDRIVTQQLAPSERLFELAACLRIFAHPTNPFALQPQPLYNIATTNHPPSSAPSSNRCWAEAGKKGDEMYGLIGKILVAPGERAAVVQALLAGTREMPGCLSYIIAEATDDADAIWVTEVWESAEHHKASLGLPSVQAAITAARPHIRGFGERFETKPLGGQGLPSK